jgi:hypothetical protein
MVDIHAFNLKLPLFVERSYYISPGVVSVIFKVIWSLFLFILVFFVVEQGLGAIAMQNSQQNDKKDSLLNLHKNYLQVQGISRGRWGEMVRSISSRRTLLGLLFWAILYGFETLFSLSIDNSPIIHYNGTNCVGRIANYDFDPFFTFDVSKGSIAPLSKNNTLLRQLTNQKSVGNIVMLGDGIFTIAPPDGLYTQGQEITVSRAGINCNTTYFSDIWMNGQGYIYGVHDNGSITSTSTPLFPNISLDNMSPLSYGYVSLKKIDTLSIDGPNSDAYKVTFLIAVSNPVYNKANDINKKLFNSTVFLNECAVFYEHGYVTMVVDGALNKTNISGNYTKVDNKTLEEEFQNSNIPTFLDLNSNWFTLYDYPDTFVNPTHNQTYLDILKTANDIIAAYFLSPFDPYADLCTFNQEETPIYISVIGTTMSFGYIIVAVAFAFVTLAILSLFVLVMYTKEERNGWFLYSKDWCYEGFLTTGSQMDKKEFEKYAEEVTIKSHSLKESAVDDDSSSAFLKHR